MGSTALMMASENGEVESVRLLLQHDVEVDHVNDLGWTALHEAVVLGQDSSNFVNVARLLLLGGPMRRSRTAPAATRWSWPANAGCRRWCRSSAAPRARVRPRPAATGRPGRTRPRLP
ncbi:ankyrin repeat domain-containing protein [Arthrobacter sp. JCM 19049]|uniref:ankyrin repeat domain-containing protein n=1 Tax=Arthrobacter sp. JCM 19049 TaxID=1460643 RepID=UPI000B2BA571|nr:ankyrin repeat domain-containing protein [Arthrobacter sp. JCM 19049]